MKKLLVYVGVVLALSSCKTALFDSLPGQEQKTFPTQLQGSYYLKVPSGFFKRTTIKDTLFFEITENGFTTRDSSEITETKLDQTHHLRLVNQKHNVLAVQDEDYKAYWNLTFVEQTKRGAKFYSVLEDEKNTVLPKYFKRTFVAVNNAGDSVFAYKTSDIQLGNYFEKVLRKKEALELVRIKK